jgi:hypothetical protein
MKGLVDRFFFFFFFRGVHLGGEILNFPTKRFRDTSMARGGFDHLMRQFRWLRFGHVLDSEWSYERPSILVIMTSQSSVVEAFSKHFSGF